MMEVRNFACYEQQSTAVTTSASAAVQFSTADGQHGKMAMVVNYGASGAQLAFGGSSVAAVATASAAGVKQYYIPAGAVMIVEKGEAQYFSAICDAGSTNLIVHAGEGS